MATFFPNAPPRGVSPEVGRVIRVLKTLPDSEFAVWQNLGVGGSPGPDFLVFKRDNRASLIKVSSATPDQARLMVQPALVPAETDTTPLGAEESRILDEFLLGIRTAGRHLGLATIRPMVVFPNITQRDLRLAAQGRPPGGNGWVSSDEIRPEHVRSWIDSHLSDPLDADSQRALRRAFTPESVIPAMLTVRTPIARGTEAAATEFLLDYNQEWVLKCDLDLSDEARRESKDLSVRLVNGVAGSGKSLIIVYRALLLRRFFPDKRILVLTHNKPLIQDLQAKYEVLSNGDTGVEWRTFISWCMSQWPNRGEDVRPIGDKRRQEILSEARARHLADTAVTEGMLESEIDWFKDRLISKRSEYIAADRTGRGFALQETMRARVFDAIVDYQEILDGLGKLDWGDVPRKIWRCMRDGVIDPPRYDAVLVDEAQFFAPIWFEIIKRLLDPSGGHLFLAADPTQGFLGRGQSWVSSGLDVRGRSHRLSRSYRMTRKILDFATWLYRTRIPNEDEDIVVPNLKDMPEGVVPVLIPLTSPQDEITRVVNEIVRLVASGVPPQHILVIHADWQGVDTLIARLNEGLGLGSARDPKEGSNGEPIRVCTLNAATGLESPIVFLVGLKGLY
ncbi:MAG: UvrD-helicase domain-containing protein, partial [Thermoleophilia bacterium]